MQKKYKYIPRGVCSSEINFLIEDNIIKEMEIKGGCPGNTQAVSKLCINRRVDEVICLLKNIKCGNKISSCPDQISKALENFKLK